MNERTKKQLVCKLKLYFRLGVCAQIAYIHDFMLREIWCSGRLWSFPIRAVMNQSSGAESLGICECPLLITIQC